MSPPATTLQDRTFWDLRAPFLAVVAFALAYFSPVEMVDADPAIALLVSQAILDHGTPYLDVYLDAPAAYNLDQDYRLRQRAGGISYYSLGVPVLSLPAVWLANRLGLHMLDQEHEFALQNLLSALASALLAVLLYRLCRIYTGARASLVLTAITLFGSSLTSTLATGLWNTVYSIPLLTAILLVAGRWTESAEGRMTPRRWALFLGLSALAFFCRPASGFAILAGLLVLSRPRRTALFLLVAAAALAMPIAIELLQDTEWSYYSPKKLVPRASLITGLIGTLFSPSRGLLVFSPFLLAVAAAVVTRLPKLQPHPLARLSLLWIAIQIPAVATKGIWWGGHSYGPRLLTELMLPALVLACLAWRLLAGAERQRRLYAVAYLGLGALAIYIHSVQGLFSPHVRSWNEDPNVDLHTELIFDWRFPQFLASAESLAERQKVREQQALEDLKPYRLGDWIAFDSSDVLFRNWYPPEHKWRWSRASSPAVLLQLEALEPDRLVLLELYAGSFGTQQVSLHVNGRRGGHLAFEGREPRYRSFAFAGRLLRPEAANELRFDVPDASSPHQTAPDPSADTDQRLLGLSLRWLRLAALPKDFDGVGFEDSQFFRRGFSTAESGWCWTDGAVAAIDYPLEAVSGDPVYTLELLAGANGSQQVSIAVQGTDLGTLELRGAEPKRSQIPVPAEILRPFAFNRIALRISDPRGTPNDRRRLGLAFVHLELRPGAG